MIFKHEMPKIYLVILVMMMILLVCAIILRC